MLTALVLELFMQAVSSLVRKFCQRVASVTEPLLCSRRSENRRALRPSPAAARSPSPPNQGKAKRKKKERRRRRKRRRKRRARRTRRIRRARRKQNNNRKLFSSMLPAL